MKNGPKRLQLEFPEPSFNRLKALKEKTEAASYSDVVKNALRLYEAVIHEVDAGGNVCVRHENGGETIYKLIF